MVQLKVRAYIIRENSGHREILVFSEPEFPDLPLQLPGGTVEPGEPLLAALGREVFEETGREIFGPYDFQFQETIVHPVSKDLFSENVFVCNFSGECESGWDHRVTGSGEDHNFLFRYSWIPIELAFEELAGWMGDHLKKVLNN